MLPRMALRAGCRLISLPAKKGAYHWIKLLWKTKTWRSFEDVVE